MIRQIKTFFKKVHSIKRRQVLTVLTVVLFSLVAANYANASFGTFIATFLGWIIFGIIWALGQLMLLVMDVLISVAQYNDFANSQVIIKGWVVARDICNMFFVVILLVIAFATILRVESYNYKKALPKLILMAVLINFSRTICGLIIDVAQVVMLTFVNSFKDIGGANLVNLLGIDKLLSLNDNANAAASSNSGGTEVEVTGWSILGSYILALIYVVVALITLITMLIMLIMRIIMMWIYVVLSPFAYLLAAFPSGQQYSSKWWGDFSKNVIVGPILAFFIWLSFAALSANTTGTNPIIKNTISNKYDLGSSANLSGAAATSPQVGVTKAGTPDAMIAFAISIAMLIGGLQIAQSIGGEAGSIAGKGMGAINKGKLLAGAAGLAGLRVARNYAGDARDYISEKTKVDLNVVAGYKRYRQQVAANRQLRKDKIRANTLDAAVDPDSSWIHRKAALFSTGDVAWQNMVDGKFLRGGSPRVDKFNSEKLREEEEKGKRIVADIDNLRNNKSLLITQADYQKNEVRAGNLEKKKIDIQVDIDLIKNSQDFKRLLDKEANGSINEKEQAKLNEKRKNIAEGESKIENYNSEIESLKRDPSDIVADDNERKAREAEFDEQISYQEGQQEESRKKQNNLQEKIQSNKLSEISTAKADIAARLEGDASKKIAMTTTSSELSSIFKEALKNGDAGMISAVAKKMAKLGNYNDLQGSLGLGTGLQGMHDLADIMQEKGGMSHQDSLALIAEIGEIAKSGKHYQGFGTVHMDSTGKWQKSTYEEQQAAILSEQAKVQTQSFVRDANRLGIGHYNGPDHTAANWELDSATVKLFASKDHAYADDLGKTGNVNMIRFIASNKKNLELLEKAGATEVVAKIKEVINKSSGASVENPRKAIEEITRLRESMNP